jgi:hypothetical protein
LLRFFRLLTVAVKSHSTQLYALIARCLAGESTPGDVMQLEKLLTDHPELKKEFELFRELLQKPSPPSESEKSIQPNFDRITKRLKDEGAL